MNKTNLTEFDEIKIDNNLIFIYFKNKDNYLFLDLIVEKDSNNGKIIIHDLLIEGTNNLNEGFGWSFELTAALYRCDKFCFDNKISLNEGNKHDYKTNCLSKFDKIEYDNNHNRTYIFFISDEGLLFLNLIIDHNQPKTQIIVHDLLIEELALDKAQKRIKDLNFAVERCKNFCLNNDINYNTVLKETHATN